MESLVQMARFAIEQTHFPYRAARMKKNPPDMVTPSEPVSKLTVPLRTMRTKVWSFTPKTVSPEVMEAKMRSPTLKKTSRR